MKRFVIAFAVLLSSLAFADRSLGCYAACWNVYDAQVADCHMLYGPGSSIADPARLAQCLNLVYNSYMVCRERCATLDE